MSSSEYGLLSITVKDGSVVDIGDNVRIVMEKRPRGHVRLYIRAPKEVRIKRMQLIPNCTDRFDPAQTCAPDKKNAARVTV